MAQMKTPGVYVDELNAFPNSVVEVATAVAAFVGYTERADGGGKSLRGKPVQVSSLAKYHAVFGGAPVPLLDMTPSTEQAPSSADGVVGDFDAAGTGWLLSQPPGPAGQRGLLYAAMVMFFQNGGGECVVVSVGDYTADVDAAVLQAGVDALLAEPEPAMLLVPDAVLLDTAGCGDVQRAMLAHCGNGMKSRMAILDVREGWKALGDGPVDEFRSAVGDVDSSWGAAYYPWLHTTLVQDVSLSFLTLAPTSRTVLIGLLRTEFDLDLPLPAQASAAQIARRRGLEALVDDLVFASDPAAAPLGSASRAIDTATVDQTLRMKSPLYRAIVAAMARRLSLLPPGPAMAGVWARVGQTYGVWRAPANVSLVGVLSTAVSLSQQSQDALISPSVRIAINPIRDVVGQGVLVWGARTLDGNNPESRDIPLRRTLIMLEQSCRQALEAYTFSPNAATTWVVVRAMIANYLVTVWKRGGLVGGVPEDAFYVRVGLGESMTADDVRDGILCVQVGVALLRPAEFIVFTIQQRMQTA